MNIILQSHVVRQERGMENDVMLRKLLKKKVCFYTAQYPFPPLSIARYSFTQLSILGHHGENENAQSSKW